MKPDNTPTYCKCGGKIVECIDEWNKRQRVLICCECSETSHAGKDVHKTSMYRKHDHLESNKKMRKWLGEI